MAGNPTVHQDARAGWTNVNAGNLFNSPDGMQFDGAGMVWIQTDGKDNNEGDFAGMGNNQMLVGDPVTGRIERFFDRAQRIGSDWADMVGGPYDDVRGYPAPERAFP